MITVSGLCVGYKNRQVLHDIDLCVAQGEFTGILGPNGSGKSTLVRTLSGVLPPASGTVRIHRQNLYSMPVRERARLCATVPQKQTAVSGMSVRELVMMGRYAHSSFWGGHPVTDKEKVDQSLISTDCLHLAERMTTTLSGGELQRVFLARALAQDTALMLLDEAASNLDAARTIELYGLLKKHNHQGMTILTVVHDLNLAALYCQRLIFLKHGRIVCDGPTQNVFTAPNLSDIYDTPILVAKHPALGVPQAHLVPGL